MPVTSVYPVLMSDDVPAAAAFYRERLGFETTFEADWYVSLRLGSFELAVLDRSHATVPDGYGATTGGVIVNIEVEDVDAEHRRVVTEGGLRPVRTLRSEPFGQRHFIVAAPDGVLVDVITPIEPAPEYAAAFAAGSPD